MALQHLNYGKINLSKLHLLQKEKRFICKALLLSSVSMMLGGCGLKLEHPYDLAAFDAGSLFSSESGLKAQGFASSLAVPDPTVDQLNAEGVSADSFALFDKTDGTVLAQNNLFAKVYPASTTKILTCLIAIERGNLDDIVTVPNESAIKVSGSSMADLKPGDQLTLRDLLSGLMVPSGNDAAVAIAAHIAGSSKAFAELMNQKARELGATHSHFVNPHGLPDDDHYTTVYDMYLIFNAALNEPEFVKIANQPTYTAVVTASDGSKREITWENGNQFYSGKYALPEGMQILAGKTGHTTAAGFCLVLAETDESGKQYVSIIMKASSYETLYNGMSVLTAKKNTAQP